MKKILAKSACRNRCIEILICGGDDANVNLDFAMAA
jgi:hypothetical protein